MRKCFVDFPVQAGQSFELKTEDAKHLLKSLRYQVDDQLVVVDQISREHLVAITAITNNVVTVVSLRSWQGECELPSKIHLYQGIPKGDKMDLIIRQAVELGVTSITPVAFTNCVVRIDEKKATKKVERWQRVAEAACKQSGRSSLVQVHMPLNFEFALKQAVATSGQAGVLIPWEAEETLTLRSYLENLRQELVAMPATAKEAKSISFFIGPEGGFSAKEIAQVKSMGAVCVSLGSRILRTETASAAVLAMITYALEL